MVGAVEGPRKPMTTVLITGASGMLGRDLTDVCADLDVRALGKSDLDITRGRDVQQSLSGVDVVVNCAAYTQVDQAEKDSDQAMAANAVGPKILAETCKSSGIRLIHLSTDYVFRGDATTPYAENSPRDPVSAYGRSKAAGEEAVLETYPEGSIIIRTAWLYGHYGPSFPRTMLTAAATRDTLLVVSDQVGQPTWSKDLARQIRRVIDSDVSTGIFHGTNSGHTSWWNFARVIFQAAGLDPERVLPTSSAEFVRPAPRPAWSVLGHDAWLAAGLPVMRAWEEAFAEAYPECFSDIVGDH
jgi:dTDP-4-dehydrorhamnose reductase